MKLYEKTAAELSDLLQQKKLSAVELIQDYFERLESVEPVLKAYINPTPTRALQLAGDVDRKRLRGESLHPLAGVPVAVKDNICTEGISTTCGSRILEKFVPPYNAAAVIAMEKAGMPVLGKTNMDEFAMGSSTENSAFYPTRNPWDPTRVPGGSSGGSAVAVSSCMAPFALGSDTGGSIRQPASFCGLVGLRPTYGRVSRYGLVAFASSLDQIGPLAVTALDAALLLGVIAGYDSADSTSLQEPVPDYTEGINNGVKGLKIGLIKENVGEGFDPEITAAVKKNLAFLQDNGALVDEISLPLCDYGLAAYYLIAPSEASSNLGRYDGVRYGARVKSDDIESMFSRTRGQGFGQEVKRRIMIGTYALSAGYYDAYYLQALKVRTLIRQEYSEAFSRFDLLIGATTPTPAFKLGEKSDDPMKMYLSDVCNINDALAGLPSLSLPCGFNADGLPLGMQITAPPLQEKLLLRVAHFIEQSGGRPTRPQLDHIVAPEGGAGSNGV